MNETVFIMRDHYRLVGTADGRIAGTWVVLLDERRGTAWVTPHDVVIYEETRRSGVVLNSDAFTARVQNGQAEISHVEIGHVSSWEHEVDDVRDELTMLLSRVAAAAWDDTAL